MSAAAKKPAMTQWHILRRCLPFQWPPGDTGTKARVVASIAVIALTSALQSMAPLLFANAVDGLASGTSALVLAPVALLVSYGLVYTLSRAIGEVTTLLQWPLMWRVSRNVMCAASAHAHSLGLRYHHAKKTGHLTDLIGRGAGAINSLMWAVVSQILPLVVQVGLIAWILTSQLAGLYALIVLVTVIAYGTALFVGTERQAPLSRQAHETFRNAHAYAVDSIFNYETIKYFGTERAMLAELRARLAKWLAVGIAWHRFRTLSGAIPAAIMGTGLTLMLWVAARQTVAGDMSVGGLVLANTYLMQVLMPLDRIGNTYREIKQSLVNVEHLVELLDQRPEIEDAAGARALADGPGRIVVRGLSFAYDVRRPVLEEVSFDVPAGTTAALVGPSGGGKTSVGRLLFRFYEPNAGAIEIDGQDIQSVTVASLRAAIGVVPQDTVLFNESIRYNLAFAAAGATQEDIEGAARMAQIHDFIAALPDGYDTTVGERGLKLSGGEKQRVAIARVLLKRPRILVFDEATSALDTRTERAIQENLRDVSRGVTTLVIAHRLSTVVHADQILVMEDGRIVERGSHEELLRTGGSYAVLWTKQQDEPAKAVA